MSQVEVVSTTDSKEDVTRAKAMYSKKTVEKPAPVEKPVEKAAAPEVVENDVVEPKETTEDVETTAEGTETPEIVQKKKGGFQKRIDKLTKEREALRAEADLWREQALKAGQKPVEKVDPEPSSPTETTKGKPSPDKFRNHDDYVEAMTDWKIEQREKAQTQARKLEQAKSDQEKSVSAFQARVKELTKTAPDLPEVLEAIDHIPLSAALQEIFVNSDNGHQLMYDLAKDPDEYERISKLSPLAAAREMGKREAKISAAPAVETTETKTTKAPAPVKPVGKSTTVSTKDPSDMTFAEYKVWYANKFGR